MSLAQSYSPRKTNTPWEHIKVKRSEQRPRLLHSPSGKPDEDSFDSPSSRKSSPYTRHHGNAKPSEPLLMTSHARSSKDRLVQHPHRKPWTLSLSPGKRENKVDENVFHRTWLSDCGNQGRWNRSLKKEFYEKQDRELFSLRPHDEKFATATNHKFWTHLEAQGMKHGGFGQGEKLDYVPERQTGRHLKSGLYTGKYENIKHAQYVCKTGNKDELNKKQEMLVDSRKPFDNRLRDDVINWQHETDKSLDQIGYDIMRPLHTKSLPQLGVEYMNR